MSWMNTLSVWQWLILGLVPPAIILLYFLKLKRQPLEVPSTFLWSRTIEDLHVNTIWQRLRRNLLLFLQLLLIALLMLTLLRPGLRGNDLTGERFIFMLDTSASMQATDVSPSRFEMAKKTLIEYIRQMEGGDVAMLVTFSDQAKTEVNYTKNKRDLIKAVHNIKVTNRTSDLVKAMQIAEGLANPSSARGEGQEQAEEALPATVYIFSDGGFDNVTDFDLGNLHPLHIQVGNSNSNNVGITAFSADRNPDHPGQLDIFARLENFTGDKVTVSMELRRDGSLVDVKQVSIPANDSESEGFRMVDIEEAELELVVTDEDDLMIDNRAFAAVNRPQRARVLIVTNGNDPLELALDTIEAQKLAISSFNTTDVLATESHQRDVNSGMYDLVIYDRCAPEVLPLSNTLFIGSMPPGDGWSRSETVSLPALIDQDRSHPLLQFVNMNDVLGFIEGFAIKGPEGTRTLIDTTEGPMMVIAPRDGLQDVVLGLPVYRNNGEANTDWPRRPSFPVFVMNVLRYLGGRHGVSGAASIRPGKQMELRSDLPVGSIRVTGPPPERTQSKIEREGLNSFVYTKTESPGIYAIREGKDTDIARRFTVNLFDSRESNLSPREIEIGPEKVATRKAAYQTRFEYWKWILIAALILLLVEWYIYNRRVYI